MEAIKAEQKPIEDAAGKDYLEPNVIATEIEELIKECKKLIDDAKRIAKEIDGVKKGTPKDIGVTLLPVAKGLVNLDKSILALAEKIEGLGKKILKNGEDLVSKEKFTPELNKKFDIQGKRLENIGGKLKKIGKNFVVISEKLGNIGGKLDGQDGEKTREYAVQLKDLGEKVKAKGGPIEELGIEIQKLEPVEKDAGTEKDLQDIENALGEIGADLEAIAKVL